MSPVVGSLRKLFSSLRVVKPVKQIDVSLNPIELIEKEFSGLHSGKPGLSSISGGQSAADNSLREIADFWKNWPLIAQEGSNRSCSTRDLRQLLIGHWSTSQVSDDACALS